MSALYFSSIAFAAHKKHGGVSVPVGRAKGYLPNRPRTCRSPRRALRAAGAPPSCGKIWEVTLCAVCGYSGVAAFLLGAAVPCLGGAELYFVGMGPFPRDGFAWQDSIFTETKNRGALFGDAPVCICSCLACGRLSDGCSTPRTPWWLPRCWRHPGRTCAGVRHPGRTRRRCR